MTVAHSQPASGTKYPTSAGTSSGNATRYGQAAKAEAKYLASSVSKLSMLDFWAGFGLIFIGITTAFFAMPVGTVVVMVLVLYNLTKPAKIENTYNGLFFTILLLAIGWALFETLTFNSFPIEYAIRRAVRMAVVVLLALQIAQKKIDIRSLLFGVAFGLLVNVIGFYAGIAPDNYGGTLTGWLNDKNQSGLYYALFGFLFVAMVRKTSHRLAAIAITAGMLWLTGSRTSLAAYAFAVLWLYFSYRLNLFGKAVLAYLFYLGVNYLEDNFARAGAFADRLGSDLLRERIDETMYRMIDVVPWYGGGLGTAQVWLQNRYFYFHNSYMTLVQEAGWLYMIVIVALMISAAFIWKQPRAQRIVIAEAAMVIIIITSQRLGEVILTVPWAIVVGLALLYLNPDKDLDASDSGHHEPGAMQKAQSSDETPALQNGELIENEAPAPVTHQEMPKKSTTSKSFDVSSIRQQARKV
ncbi:MULTISPECIES: O-antigen ligase [Rothia]|uniref:O-antigen ligase family protein n=1 Tax=Rothia TaxID=32207 RepID=UPI0008A9BCB7|nr:MULTISPECIES: O-antigen ligase family protein [Rothia]OHQ15791.1 zinc ABC transporter permease [Rothia sp. HMSC064F07]